MFTKKDFKFLLDFPKDIQVAIDLDSYIILKQEQDYFYVSLHTKDIYCIKKIDTVLPAEEFCIRVSIPSFIDALSQVHGTQHIFTISKDEMKLIKKKTGDIAKVIHLSSSQYTDNISYTKRKDEKKFISNAEAMLSVLKRYQCSLEYFRGFNSYSLFLNNGLELFGTDGIHSMTLKLSESMDTDDKGPYYVDSSQLNVLKVFLSDEKGPYSFQIRKNVLTFLNDNVNLHLTLEKNEDVPSIEAIYEDLQSDGETISQEQQKNIIDFFTREKIRDYKEKYNVKESYEVYVECCEGRLTFDDEIVVEPFKQLLKPICMYHLIEWLKGIKGDECQLYSDRIETKTSTLYF